MALTLGQLKRLAQDAGFSATESVIAAAVAMAESGGDPAVTNTKGNSAGTDRGLWQINDHYNADIIRAQGGNWQDPAANARMAYAVYRRQGWAGWYGFKSGRYRQYVAPAQIAIPAPVGGSLPNPLAPVSAGLDAAKAGANMAAKAGAWLSSRDNWFRVAKVAAGLWLLYAGVVGAIGTPAVEAAGKVVGVVGPGSKVAKVAKGMTAA